MAKHTDHESGGPIEGNAAEALKAIGGVAPGFSPINTEPGKKWALEGNAGEALDAVGGVEHYGKSSSITKHGPVEVPPVERPSAKTD